MGLWLRGTYGSLVPLRNSSIRLPSDFFIMVMAVLDFVLIQINSLSYSFYNHSLFRILKVFKSMRALRAIRVLRRLRSLPPRLLVLAWKFSRERAQGPGFPGSPL